MKLVLIKIYWRTVVKSRVDVKPGMPGTVPVIPMQFLNSAIFRSQKFHSLDQPCAKYVSFSAILSLIYSYSVLFWGNHAETPYFTNKITVVCKYATFCTKSIECSVFCSQEKMPPLLPIQRDGRCGVHETAGAWRDTLFLQRSVQHMCAGRVCGESARLPRKLPVLSCSSALTVAHLHVFERW